MFDLSRVDLLQFLEVKNDWTEADVVELTARLNSSLEEEETKKAAVTASERTIHTLNQNASALRQRSAAISVEEKASTVPLIDKLVADPHARNLEYTKLVNLRETLSLVDAAYFDITENRLQDAREEWHVSIHALRRAEATRADVAVTLSAARTSVSLGPAIAEEGRIGVVGERTRYLTAQRTLAYDRLKRASEELDEFRARRKKLHAEKLAVGLVRR